MFCNLISNYFQKSEATQSSSDAAGATDTKMCSHDSTESNINQSENNTKSQSQDSSTSNQLEEVSCSHDSLDNQSESSIMSRDTSDSQSGQGNVSCDQDSSSVEFKFAEQCIDSASRADSVQLDKEDSLKS